MVVVGIAMLQGARHAHIEALNRASEELGIDAELIELRTVEDLSSSAIQALILPGGESTVMRLRGNDQTSGLLPALFAWMRTHPDAPVLATCAGAILLSDPQDGGESLIDADIDRNAYGRQSESFQVELDDGFPGVFIRAPRYVNCREEVIATHQGEAVGLRKANRISLTFHPELSGDSRFHRMLLEACP